MKFKSKSSTSLVSLVRGEGTTTSPTESRISSTDTGRFSLLQFLPLHGGGRNKKGGGGGSSSRALGRTKSTSSSSLISLADENRTMSLRSLGGSADRSINGGISSSPQNRTFLLRNSKSTMSLRSLGINNGGGEDLSSCSSCSNFTHLATPKAILQLEEFDDDLALIGCPHHHHHHTCTEESIKNQSSSSSSSVVIKRVDRNDYRKVCFIGKGSHADVYMVINPNTGESYALKSLNPKRIKDPEMLILAATDLAIEAKILSGLSHENIVQLKCICATSFSQSFTEGTDEGYFLILDLLEGVLSDRLERWRRDSTKLSSFENKWSLTSAKLNIKKMYGRMENVALGIVKGMIYLHEKGIIIRDLKPPNVGFDKEGKVRLFDFGMARKLEDCDYNDICGSPRYV
jgi:hypothetical protein